jgi:hypothetical protein
MSTLWTPSGEWPVGGQEAEQRSKGQSRPRSEPPADSAETHRSAPGSDTGPSGGSAGAKAGPSEDETRARLEELRAELANTPAETVIANHAVGLFELARLHLSTDPPKLQNARLAIDAYAALVEGLGDRLGPAAGALAEGLSQIRLAFVEVQRRLAGAGGS